MRVRLFSVVCLAAAVTACAAPPPAPPAAAPFSVVEASFADMQQAMADGRVTSRQLVEQYLQRLALYEERVNATLAVNPKALDEADRLDAERQAGKVRGPLHGIPIALKDNIHTTDMPTTGGAVAFEGYVPPYDATLTTHLREAGAVILAKTVLTELANFIAAGMPGNYSGLGGYGLNPYDPRRDPRDATADGRPAAGTGGFELGHRHGGELLGGQRRHRNLGFGVESLEPEHAGGHQADGRARQPLRRDSDHRRSGHRRADGQVRRRRGGACWARWRAPRRIRTTRRPAPARRRPTATTPCTSSATA